MTDFVYRCPGFFPVGSKPPRITVRGPELWWGEFLPLAVRAASRRTGVTLSCRGSDVHQLAVFAMRYATVARRGSSSAAKNQFRLRSEGLGGFGLHAFGLRDCVASLSISPVLLA